MTISGLDTPFDHLFRLSTFSDQAVNVSSTDDFAPNPRFCLLPYHCCHLRPSSYQAMNISSINQPTNRRSRSTSSSISSQTPIGTNTPQSHNLCPHYFYNSHHYLDMTDSLKTINQELARPNDWVSFTVLNSQKEFAELPTMDISMIGAASFNTLVQQASHAKNMEIFSILICNIEKVLVLKSTTNSVKKLPTKYHDFLDVFSRVDVDIQPPHRPYNHKIPLMEEKTPLWGFLYSMSQDKLKVLKKYLEENFSKRFPQPSSSPTTSSVFFARKPESGLRFCIDYKQLNVMTIKNQYPLPLIKKTLERICKAKIYGKIDIIATFNDLCMQQGEE